jgi:hypothetical protein
MLRMRRPDPPSFIRQEMKGDPMTTDEIIMAVIGGFGFRLGLRAYFRDKGVQKRLVAIEEESHARLIFGMGQPSRDELRYRLTWTGRRGTRNEEGRVPL